MAAVPPGWEAIIADIGLGAVARELSRELPYDAVGKPSGAGFGGPRIPVEYGGGGLTPTQFVDILIDPGRADSNIVQLLRGRIGFAEFVLALPAGTTRDFWFAEITGSGTTVFTTVEVPDRHCRNARIIVSHNPGPFRARAVGDHPLSGGSPARLSSPSSDPAPPAARRLRPTADRHSTWHDAAVDGNSVFNWRLPGSCAAFVNHALPVLQDRGPAQREYEPAVPAAQAPRHGRPQRAPRTRRTPPSEADAAVSAGRCQGDDMSHPDARPSDRLRIRSAPSRATPAGRIACGRGRHCGSGTRRRAGLVEDRSETATSPGPPPPAGRLQRVTGGASSTGRPEGARRRPSATSSPESR